MSKLWILVHDRKQNGKVVKEVPTDVLTLQADLKKVEAQYPYPAYDTSTAGSTQSTATGTQLLKGWDHDGFDAVDRKVAGAAAH